ncbi:hypothetical protein Clacol_010289 [Clathrus columnatus]|uniref:Uncharacterized protein n=1 Tax=Clathrus columnatus TaxID=1419009 RepID=A0AAV5ATE9_9AGAM|nr:hypothetical protein Clacol_010289 [Clathrus columnatus]
MGSPNSQELQKLGCILNGLRREKDMKNPTVPLLTPPSRDNPTNQIENDITQALKKEERIPEQLKQEKVADAFPA